MEWRVLREFQRRLLKRAVVYVLGVTNILGSASLQKSFTNARIRNAAMTIISLQ